MEQIFSKLSVLPAGCRLPVVSYDWLACGTFLRNATRRSVFRFFGTGSSVKG